MDGLRITHSIYSLAQFVNSLEHLKEGDRYGWFKALFKAAEKAGLTKVEISNKINIITYLLNFSVLERSAEKEMGDFILESIILL